MCCDAPEPAPPPCVLADLCERRAWDDDVDDGSRMLLEWAADTIRSLIVSNARHASRAEQMDAKAESYAAYMLAAGVNPPSRLGGDA